MIQVIVDHADPCYGPGYSAPPGAIARPGASPFRHRFGGSSWAVRDPEPIEGGPNLILTLDLADPLLADLAIPGLSELPLCGYVSCDPWQDPQLYRIRPEAQAVDLVGRGEPATEARSPEFGPPFPESPLRLDPMLPADYPTTEDAYWDAFDPFLRAGGFLRVSGPPLWVDSPMVVHCSCRRDMRYVAAMGYEGVEPYSGLLGIEPVYFGEAAFYWFLCAGCLQVAVVAQDT